MSATSSVAGLPVTATNGADVVDDRLPGVEGLEVGVADTATLESARLEIGKLEDTALLVVAGGLVEVVCSNGICSNTLPPILTSSCVNPPDGAPVVLRKAKLCHEERLRA